MTDDLSPMGGAYAPQRRDHSATENEYGELWREMIGSIGKFHPSIFPFFEFNKCEERLRQFAASFEHSTVGVHAFLLAEHHRDAETVERLGGAFLSLVYPRVTERVITYDLPIFCSELGYRLPRNKLLLATTPTRGHFGEQAKGVAVALAPTGSSPGNLASGIVVATAPVDVVGLPHHCDRGVLVLQGGAKEWSGGEYDDAGNGHIITPGAIWASVRYDLRENTWRMPFGHIDSCAVKLLETPALRACLDQFVEDCGIGPERLFERYGPNPALAIARRIRRLLP